MVLEPEFRRKQPATSSVLHAIRDTSRLQEQSVSQCEQDRDIAFKIIAQCRAKRVESNFSALSPIDTYRLSLFRGSVFSGWWHHTMNHHVCSETRQIVIKLLKNRIVPRGERGPSRMYLYRALMKVCTETWKPVTGSLISVASRRIFITTKSPTLSSALLKNIKNYKLQNAVCCNNFIHRHFHRLGYWLLWCESAGDTISLIACCQLLRCESCIRVLVKLKPRRLYSK
jgi:hypothetical protein